MSDNVDVEFGKDVEGLNRILHIDGVRLSITGNTFEISVHTNTEVWEQQTIGILRKWIRWRKTQAQLREPWNLPR
jgi:hypothetical protein